MSALAAATFAPPAIAGLGTALARVDAATGRTLTPLAGSAQLHSRLSATAPGRCGWCVSAAPTCAHSRHAASLVCEIGLQPWAPCWCAWTLPRAQLTLLGRSASVHAPLHVPEAHEFENAYACAEACVESLGCRVWPAETTSW